MLTLQGHLSTQPVHLSWRLPRSKSLWARRLLLDALEGCRQPLRTDEALPDDIRALASALDALEQGETVIDVLESGTAMRLMLAYLAGKTDRPRRLCGQGRQHQRPIAPLVEALRELGAKIDYLGEAGYPPLAISPASLTATTAHLDASASSQYLSALFLLAPFLAEVTSIDTRPHGIASRPYAQMTLALLAERGYRWEEREEGCFTYRGRVAPSTAPLSEVEGDWSAASYAYSLLTFLPVGSTCSLPSLQMPSLQGDAEALQEIFGVLGIQTERDTAGICLKRVATVAPPSFVYGMQHCPDLAPAVVVAFLGQAIPFQLTGVAHLRIKESDRLLALQTELAKLGYPLNVAPDALAWQGRREEAPTSPLLSPHGDHRIAMALAPLALHQGELRLSTPEVVAKSFPHYWQELRQTRLFTTHLS